MSTSERGELMRVKPETGELVPDSPPPATIGSIIAGDTGNLSDELVASFDLDTPEGANRLDRYLSFQSNPNDAANQLNVEFDMTGFVMKPVIIKKGADGVAFQEPKLAVRTVIEDSSGKFVASSSSWLAKSVQEIVKRFGPPSLENPMRVVMRKAGNSYKLFKVHSTALLSSTEKSGKAKQAK